MGSLTSPRPLSELAATIANNAKILEDWIESQGLVQPTFEPDPPQPGWKIKDAKIEAARDALGQAAQDLFDLTLGPEDVILRRCSVTKWDVITSKIISDYNFYKAVPLGGSATFAEIGEATGLPEDFVSRILRYATSLRLFREIEPGRIAHTAQSASQARNPDLAMRESFFNDSDLKVALALPETIKKYPEIASYGDPKRAIQTALNLDEPKNYFDIIATEDEKREQFHIVMGSLQEVVMGEGIEHAPFWSQLPNGSTIVDVGGSTGHNSIRLAKFHPQLNFIVQDLPEVITQSQKDFDLLPGSEISAEERKRISFKSYNFFEPQTVKAPVYLLRYILHDWPDHVSEKILKNLLTAMTPGSRIVIVDILLVWTEKIPLIKAKAQRATDLDMMVDFCSKERDIDDWHRLLAQVDSRLEIESIFTPRGSSANMSMLIVKYT